MFTQRQFKQNLFQFLKTISFYVIKVALLHHKSHKHQNGFHTHISPYNKERAKDSKLSIHDFGPGFGNICDAVVVTILDPHGVFFESHTIEGEYTHNYLLTRDEFDTLRTNLNQAQKEGVAFSYGAIPLMNHADLVLLNAFSPKIMNYA